MPDVDTDGDGKKDSFWMDLGLAIITNEQGQRFKPLFAIQIKSMDGRLNANAHSNRTHVDPNGLGYVDQQQTLAGNVTKLNSAVGLGMGVPEINLLGALNDDVDKLTDPVKLALRR